MDKASRSQPESARDHSLARGDTQPSAAFTPAPWGTEYRYGAATTVVRADGFPVAICGIRPLSAPELATEEANARLIAAAPDLYEAAKVVLAGLCERIDAAPKNAVPVFAGIADLHAAIAKAEGR
jgi:hypothetical protein